MKILTLIPLLVLYTRSCFIVHFVYYAGLPMYYFDRFVNFPHPYTFHYNEPINWIKGFKVNRVMSYVEQADIKRMEVLYNYGGVYLDSDMLVDIECLKEKLCTKKEDRLYLMDWVYKDSEKWLKSVPIAFLYAPKPKIPVFQRILTSYNQAIDQTLKFSGPYYMQQFKDQFRFLQIQQKCQLHIGTQTIYATNDQFNWVYRGYQRFIYQSTTQQQKQLRRRQTDFFKQLWQTKSVIYPANFNYRQFGQFNPQFNHVELIDKQRLIIKIIKYSNNSQTKQKILHLLQVSRINQRASVDKTVVIEHAKTPFDHHFPNKFIQQSKFPYQRLFVLVAIISILFLAKKIYINFFSEQVNRVLAQRNYTQIYHQQNRIIQNSHGQQAKIKIFYLVSFIILICIIIYFANSSDKEKKYINQEVNTIKTNIKQNQQIQQFYQQFEPQTRRMLDFNKNYRKMFGIQRSDLLQSPYIDLPLSQIGLVDNVQIDSKFDYLNLKYRKQFLEFKQKFEDTITFDLYQFDYNQSLQKPKQFIKYVEFNSSIFMDDQLENMQNWSGGQKLPQNLKTYLASYLVYNKTTKRVKQLQHYYYNKLYKIDSIPDEIPMCVLSTGYQVYSKGKYQRFFESIEQQNYSNYHIVIIDDKSPDNSGIHFYEHLKNTTFKLKNRVKIIRNHVNVGGLANMYIYAKKFCNENDIVLNIDTDDMLIGHQVFNVLNSVYQDPNIWYAYTRYFSQLSYSSVPILGSFSLPITVNISEHRLAAEWNTSHMRTYRQQLMARVPLQQFIEYFHDKKHNMFLPRFYTIAQDRFTVYAHLQLAGNQRIKFIEEPFYFYDQSGTSKLCYYQYEHLIQYRSRVKRIIKPLDSIDGDLQYYPDQAFPTRIIEKFKKNYDLFTKCMKMFYDHGTLA